jgi:hypothetical protein
VTVNGVATSYNLTSITPNAVCILTIDAELSVGITSKLNTSAALVAEDSGFVNNLNTVHSKIMLFDRSPALG